MTRLEKGAPAMKLSNSLFLILATALALAAAGCGKKYIPNTQIEDTEFNREIIGFCERYRHAVEDMNIGLLLSLASPRYFDNAGSPTGDDDFDRTGLEEVLNERFRAVKAIRYEIRYRDIFEQQNVVYVEFTYTLSFQYDVGGETKWSNKTADNRLEIERVDGGYLILAGM
jgi:hypothetical protein